MVTKAQAAKAEAKEEMLSFDYDGHTYTAPVEINLDALEALEGSNTATFMRLLVGVADYREFRKTHSTRSELLAFFTAYDEALGAKN